MPDVIVRDSSGIMSIRRTFLPDAPLPASIGIADRQRRLEEAEADLARLKAEHATNVAALAAAKEARVRSVIAADDAEHRVRLQRELLAQETRDAQGDPAVLLQLDRARAALSAMQARYDSLQEQRSALLTKGQTSAGELMDLDKLRAGVVQIEGEMRAVRNEVRRLDRDRFMSPVVPPTLHVETLIAEALTPAPMLRPSKVDRLLGRVA